MWQEVAKEMGIPWRSAESMHWQLGEQGMSDRTKATFSHPHDSVMTKTLRFSSPTHGLTPAHTAQMMHNTPQAPTQQYQPPPPYHNAHHTATINNFKQRRNGGSHGRRQAGPRSRSSQLCHSSTQPLQKVRSAVP